MRTKQIKQSINNKYSAIPNAQIAPGIYLDKIGNKYVHLVNTWESTSCEKVLISEFYHNNIKGDHMETKKRIIEVTADDGSKEIFSAIDFGKESMTDEEWIIALAKADYQTNNIIIN